MSIYPKKLRKNYKKTVKVTRRLSVTKQSSDACSGDPDKADAETLRTVSSLKSLTHAMEGSVVRRYVTSITSHS